MPRLKTEKQDLDGVGVDRRQPLAVAHASSALTVDDLVFLEVIQLAFVLQGTPGLMMRASLATLALTMGTTVLVLMSGTWTLRTSPPRSTSDRTACLWAVPRRLGTPFF